MLRMEDRIRRLCSELLATADDEELRPILVELREALHQHIGRLRERFGSYPFLVERRTRNDTSRAKNQEQESPGKQTGPTSLGT